MKHSQRGAVGRRFENPRFALNHTKIDLAADEEIPDEGELVDEHSIERMKETVVPRLSITSGIAIPSSITP